MRDILTSPRAIEINRRQRVRRIRLLVLIFTLCISLVGALAYFSADRHVTIHTVVVTGNKLINTDQVQTLVLNDISGRYFHLFSRANSLIYPKSKIYNDLVSTFTRIDQVSISRDSFNTLHVAIVERSATYLYCGASVPTVASDIGENCYFVNSDGYIFDKAPYFSGDVYFKYYLTLGANASVNPLGKQILTPELFHEIARFIDGVDALGFTSTSLVANPEGDYTLSLVSTGTNTPVIIFNTNEDLSTTLDNLTLAMQKPEFANAIRQKYATLQYIDLRFKNKVLYKFN